MDRKNTLNDYIIALLQVGKMQGKDQTFYLFCLIWANGGCASMRKTSPCGLAFFYRTV
jgi:hypothetical protein